MEPLVRELLREFAERVEAKLVRVESALDLLVKQQTVKEWYLTKDVALILRKKEYTVREWCRLGRVHAQKLRNGRGNQGEWRISHEELIRIQNEGLLPDRSKYA